MSRERRRLPLTERSAAPHTCSSSVRLEVLNRMPLFSELTCADIRDLEPLVRSRGYRAGEMVHRAGDMANSLFVVASGTVKLLRPSVHGQDVVTNILGPGEGFGTLGILGESTYPDTAEAMTVSCVLEISSDVFNDVMGRYPRLALTVLDEVLHRFEQAQQAIRRLSADNAKQRVAAALLALVDKLGVAQDGAFALELPLTRVDLAALTGLTSETVSRVMSRLRDDGIVDTGRRWTVVLDRTRLAAEAAE
ncbi:hypothetical protein BFN01_13815 [Microbacterium sp. AR7-10]|nr:hypothetical protein BFN01_13815 [Microbacterium sp. AR7-10]